MRTHRARRAAPGRVRVALPGRVRPRRFRRRAVPRRQAIARYAAASTRRTADAARAGHDTAADDGVAAAARRRSSGCWAVSSAWSAAWVASNWFPFGTAKLFEPSPGRQWDWLVWLPVAVLIVAARRRRRGGGSAAGGCGPRGATALAAVRWSRRALAGAGPAVPSSSAPGSRSRPGGAETSVPVRPALIGAVIGVLGVVAAFTFSHGGQRRGDQPGAIRPDLPARRLPRHQQPGLRPGRTCRRDLLAEQPEVTGLDDSRTAVATAPNGARHRVALGVRAEPASRCRPSCSAGGCRSAADEVLLAPQVAQRSAQHVGDTVALTGSHRRVRRSAWSAPGSSRGARTTATPTAAGSRQPGYERAVHRLQVPHRAGLIKPGLSVARTRRSRMTAGEQALPELHGGRTSTYSGDAPDRDRRDPRGAHAADRARRLPRAAGRRRGGHALATAVRRRSHDLAVLRALGMTQMAVPMRLWSRRPPCWRWWGWSSAYPSAWPSDGTVWRVVADYTPLQYVPPLAVWPLLLVGPAALVIANLLAAWPGHRAARLRVAPDPAGRVMTWTRGRIGRDRGGLCTRGRRRARRGRDHDAAGAALLLAGGRARGHRRLRGRGLRAAR